MGTQTAGKHLAQLLAQDPGYRKIWERHSLRPGPGVSEAAVCRALACHLWDAGERPESDTHLPRRLRDLVSRALTGRVLTRRTVLWFAEAFTMRPADRDALLAMLCAPDEASRFTRTGSPSGMGVIVTMVLPPTAVSAAGPHVDVLVRIGDQEYRSRASVAHLAHPGAGVALGLDMPVSEQHPAAG